MSDFAYPLHEECGVFGIYELLPAFLVGLLVIVVVSLLTKKPDTAIEQEFDLARSHSVL